VDLALTQRVTIATALVTAVVAGWNVAQGELLFATVLGGALAMWLASWLTGVTLDALLAGAMLVGYLVGNRGFAQLHVPGVPLLPAELVLGIGMPLMLWRAAHAKTLPLRRDPLNVLILLWIALGTARMPMDFQRHGLMALRDFALVYYSSFFFLAQEWSARPTTGRYVSRCIVSGMALTAPAFIAFLVQPDWLVSHLAIAGTPLIFVKNDVAGGFMAGAALWFVNRFTVRRRWGWLVLAMMALVGLSVANNRGSVVALLIGIAVLVPLRAWRMLRVLLALLALGLAGLAVQAAVSPRPFTASLLYRLYESAASVADVSGSRLYQAAGLDDKPDNNQFRLVWWGAVVDETWEEGRWFGLGFGHDLAGNFLRIYYADDNDEFNVRSPHNFLLSVFGRMGLTGFVLLFAILVMVGRRTWRARHTVDDFNSPLPLWLGAWTILGSACFGVVLEGPMGAVVFWTILGMANATHAEPQRDTVTADSTASEHVPSEEERRELAQPL